MRTEKERRWQFVKLCSILTKTGFNFTTKDFVIKLNIQDFNRIFEPETRMIFTNSIEVVSYNKKFAEIKPNLWAEKHLNR